MLTNGSRYWLGVFAIFVIDLFVTATVQAASPTPISSCPYNIATAGSYAVTNDLKATGTCITISVSLDNVAIDLQGHSITGVGAGYGIVCPNLTGFPCNHILVANGTIVGFATGIFLFGNYNTVANMTVQGSTGSSPSAPGNGNGVILTGDAVPNTLNTLNVVVNTTSVGNAGDGIYVDAVSYVADSVANNNGKSGIEAPASSAIINSQTNGNSGYGINMATGFVTGSTSKNNAVYGIFGGNISVSNSTASNNGSDGIAAGLSPAGGGSAGGGSVTNSTAQQNGGRGISLLCPVSAFGNKANNNQGGNLVTSDNTCLLVDNKAP
jgi:hypothetical protein